MSYIDKIFDKSFVKCIPIHGIVMNGEINTHVLIDNELYRYKYVNLIKLISYDKYLKEYLPYEVNKGDIKECTLVAVFMTEENNSMEVENLKVVISQLYFANRLANANNFKNEITQLVDNEYFHNYCIPGYFNNENRIELLDWYISLGNNPIARDNFDRFLTRGFSYGLNDEYYNQASLDDYKNTVSIDVNSDFYKKASIIENRLNEGDEYSKKIRSALRLYYNLLYENDTEQSILTCASILETLLLKRNETKAQKSKVANRCACLVADHMSKEHKTFIANHVSYFYCYRNAIIHDGKSYLEIDDEVTMSRIMYSIKHIIYFILKFAFEHDIKDINEIKHVVRENLQIDGIDEKVGYITFSKENNSKIQLIFID